MSNTKAYMKEWRLKNKEKIKEAASIYFQNNKEKFKEAKLRNMERNRERAKEYYLENRECVLNQRKEYRLKNKDALKERKRKHYLENWEKSLLSAIRERCIKKEIPFNLSVEDIVVPEFCPVFGVKLEAALGRARGNSPSIDRIVPSLGYIKGNIQVISWFANKMKQDAAPEELVLFAKWVQRTYPEMF